jgi:eukaryotic-like serine/threonine-protein kinase
MEKALDLAREANNGVSCTFAAPGYERHPINCVDWMQAAEYCEAYDKRLPTEVEWEYAARGEKEAETRPRRYPWGNAEPLDQLCWRGGPGHKVAAARPGSGPSRRVPEIGLGPRIGACEVGAFPLGDGVRGVHDLAGNVWEWTSSAYCPYTTAGTMAQCDGEERVVRGGAWTFVTARVMRASARRGENPSSGSGIVGFRCAKSL